MMGKGDGGLERAGADCHEALELSGARVVSVIHSSSKLLDLYRLAGSTITLTSLGPWDVFAAYLLRLKLLRREFRNTDFDAVVVHGNRAVFLARRLGLEAPVIAVCHTTNYNILKCLNLIDGAIVLTDHYHRVLVKAGTPPERIRIVPNSIRLSDEPGDPPARDVPIIGGLGRLVPNKGFDVLLSACAELKARGIAFRCIVHGVDTQGSVASHEKIRDQLGLDESEVSFAGWTDDPHRFLREIDIFCMPSRREVLSIALLESLAAGRPVVCTNVPGLEQVFAHGVEGYFVDIEDDRQLADMLGILLLDRALRIKMGRAARRRAHDFDINVVGRQLENAVRELS